VRSCIVAARAIVRRYVAALTNNQSVVAIEHAVDGRIESIEVFWRHRTGADSTEVGLSFAFRAEAKRRWLWSSSEGGRPCPTRANNRLRRDVSQSSSPGESPGVDLR